jgi:hypothetical protein
MKHLILNAIFILLNKLSVKKKNIGRKITAEMEFNSWVSRLGK